MGFYSMPRYFEHMPQVGKPMKKANPENEAQLKAIEAEIHELITPPSLLAAAMNP